MNLLIDANIFQAIYEEDIGLPTPRPERTGPANLILDQAIRPSRMFIDDGGQIESEWKNRCGGDIEWFDAWLAEQFRLATISPITIENKHRIRADKAKHFGFPSTSHDIWYLRVAYATKDVQPGLHVYLVTEDIDFYDPAMKAAKNKVAKIKSGSGPVAKHLKKEGVNVCCISTYLVLFP